MFVARGKAVHRLQDAACTDYEMTMTDLAAVKSSVAAKDNVRSDNLP